jgi:hypothetical protein
VACPIGQIGSPPDCHYPPTCPAGQTGAPPNCRPDIASVAQSFVGQTKIPAAVARAWRVGPDWSGYCEAFVGYVTAGLPLGRGFTSAYADYMAHKRLGEVHQGVPPRNAVVYFNPPASDGAGHIAISLGDGTVVSTYGFAGQDLPIEVHSYNFNGFKPYLGWTLP